MRAGDLQFSEDHCDCEQLIWGQSHIFDSFVHSMSCTESRPAHQRPGGPIYFCIYLQGNLSSPCAWHCTRLWAVQGNDACPSPAAQMEFTSGPSHPSMMLLFPPGTTPELGCFHPQPTSCGLTCPVSLLHSLVSLQQVIKSKLGKDN